MNFCVISDTHGVYSNLILRLQMLEGSVDGFWFLGDYTKDAKAMSKILKKEIVIVKGNCDVHSNAPEVQILEIENKRIMLAHGHLMNVKNSLTTIYYNAISESVDLVCFGHTHQALYLVEEDLILFNPGSPTSPRGSAKPSIGLVTIREDYIACEHLFI